MFPKEIDYAAVINLLMAAAFLVQLLLCFKVKNIAIRLIPAVILFALTTFFFVMTYYSSGWDSVGYVILSLYSGLLLFMSAVGWVIWLIVRILKKIKSNSHRDSLQ